MARDSYHDTFGDFVFGVFLLIVFALISATITLVFGFDKICYGRAKVVAIGGCDREGYCGVELDNGHFRREHLPVLGEPVCVSSSYVFKWSL